MHAVADDFYDLIREGPGRPPRDFTGFFTEIINRTAEVEVEAVAMDDEGFADSEVYTQAYIHGRITVMSAFRKDLFISVTLPLLGLGALVFTAIGGSFIYTNSSFTRLDDHSRSALTSMAQLEKAQGITNEQIASMVKAQEVTNQKLEKIADTLGSLDKAVEVLKVSQKAAPDS
ncbi:hypothetical protein LU642_28850 [Pseudomonas asiatica]|uniref:hypothetical protein n=1 Tax=Pseudomonas asiatica TaxID=2219225 RepID=UPI001E5F6FBB|nr:hypothetical protein [Pseudomonas asiatica]MCE1084595.1 hypothetical protein [Pseudomonas asiatica]